MLQGKMQEYLENGADLGWLLDTVNYHVYIYRPGQPVERLVNPNTLSGESTLPGFSLNLRELW
jgi:Uma2 family endonuclease